MTTLQALIERRAFGVARVLGGEEIALSPSWFVGSAKGEGQDGLNSDLGSLFGDGDPGEDSEPDLPELHRLFEREAGGLSLQVKAGESGTESGQAFTDFIASTADVDRMGDIVEQSWRLAAWRSNPVIMYEHGRDPAQGSVVVGRGTGRVNREADRLEIRSYWDTKDINPLGQLMAHQHANGFRRAGSVGFMPGKAIGRASLPDDDPRKAPKGTPAWQAGHLFRFNELLEHTTTAVPANRAAVQLSQYARSFEGEDDQLDAFVRESMAKSAAANVLEALKDEAVRKAIAALIWAQPQEPEAKGIPNNLSNLFGA